MRTHFDSFECQNQEYEIVFCYAPPTLSCRAWKTRYVLFQLVMCTQQNVPWHTPTFALQLNKTLPPKHVQPKEPQQVGSKHPDHLRRYADAG